MLRERVGFALFAGAAAWNAGNVGPAAAAISSDLDISLAAVGVLGGTVFFAGLVVAKLGAARLTAWIGSGGAARSACLAAIAGNVVIAASPASPGIAAGRLLAGYSLAGSVLALARRSARKLPAWRLEFLFMTALGVPYVLGVWLVPFMTEDAGFSAGLAGVLGVVLYAMAAVMRPEGSRLEAEGRSLRLLGGVAPMVAGVGLILLAATDSPAIAIAGVVLAGIGFAIPYAAMYDEAERLFPEARIAAVGPVQRRRQHPAAGHHPSRRRGDRLGRR